MTPHALGELAALHLGRVTDNQDPEGRARVKVRLLALNMEVWASVVAPSAGSGYGASFVPRVDEVVVLAFITPELPLVLGSIWSGSSSAPGEADPQEDVYVIRTPSGVVVELDDGDGPRVSLTTPQGYSVVVTDGGGGEIAVTRGSQSVRLTASEVSVQSSGTVSIQAGGSVSVSASMVQVDAGISKFSGVVQADTLIANSVVGASYTPGAGNIW
ncbi:MAG: phage baseplate assembly protein V [Chromatiaceae bacterium]|jgi:uncharacterized protein involved in type VI secretion and phage assembly